MPSLSKRTKEAVLRDSRRSGIDLYTEAWQFVKDTRNLENVESFDEFKSEFYAHPHELLRRYFGAGPSYIKHTVLVLINDALYDSYNWTEFKTLLKQPQGLKRSALMVYRDNRKGNPCGMKRGNKGKRKVKVSYSPGPWYVMYAPHGNDYQVFTGKDRQGNWHWSPYFNKGKKLTGIGAKRVYNDIVKNMKFSGDGVLSRGNEAESKRLFGIY